MTTLVKTSMIEGDLTGSLDQSEPITIIAAGQSNMVGWTGADNGPFFAVPNVTIWDTTTQTFRPADLTQTYDVYCGDPGVSIKTIGGGRNNLAVAFAYRLQKETGRRVRIVYNATGGRHSLYWIGNGRNSVDWQALLADLEAAGVDKVDYFLWQQGESDSDDGDIAGTYTARLGSLRSQIMAEDFWKEDSVILIGKPCQQWSQTAYLAYLNSEIDAFGAIGHLNVGIAQSVSPYFQNSPYFGVSGDLIHFSGKSLYSLGYYNYWNAVPSWKISYKKTLRELFAEYPYPEGIYEPADAAVAYSVGTLNTPPSKFNLEPSITRVGSRFFVAYTANKVNTAGAPDSFVKITYTDNEWTTVVGATGSGAGFINSGAAAPKLWACPDGSLWCFFMGSNNSSTFDAIAGVWLSVCHNPTGTTPRWSTPRKVVKYGWAQDPVKFEGQWYLPISYWRLPLGGGSPSFVPALAGRHLVKIDYSSVTFDHDRVVGVETADSSFDEFSIIPLISGRMRASWRTTNGPVYSDATDYHGTSGSWTTPAAVSNFGSPRPASKHWTTVSPTGRHLAVWNDAADRSNLTLGGSDLGAQSSWATTKVVLQAGRSAYPSIYADGTNIWVAYDNADRETVTGGGTGGKIRVAKISEANLAAGVNSVTTFIVDDGL